MLVSYRIFRTSLYKTRGCGVLRGLPKNTEQVGPLLYQVELSNLDKAKKTSGNTFLSSAYGTGITGGARLSY